VPGGRSHIQLLRLSLARTSMTLALPHRIEASFAHVGILLSHGAVVQKILPRQQ
jgi:hypothetical protein